SEQGLLGSRAYVTDHFADAGTMQPKPEHALVSAYFNVAGGSGAVRGIYAAGNHTAAEVLGRWMAPFKDRGVTIVSERPGERSDHYPFNAVGIPAFSFSQAPIDRLIAGTNMDMFER